jgi:hypothetical protein
MRWRPASGRRKAEADDARAGEVRLTGSTDEIGEQNGLARCGVDGGKQWDREECGDATHGPDSAPDKLCPKRKPAYVGPLTAARRYLLAIGAVCGNSARTDLCGGRPVMGVPTAILGRQPLYANGNCCPTAAPEVSRGDVCLDLRHRFEGTRSAWEAVSLPPSNLRSPDVDGVAALTAGRVPAPARVDGWQPTSHVDSHHQRVRTRGYSKDIGSDSPSHRSHRRVRGQIHLEMLYMAGWGWG